MISASSGTPAASLPDEPRLRRGRCAWQRLLDILERDSQNATEVLDNTVEDAVFDLVLFTTSTTESYEETLQVLAEKMTQLERDFPVRARFCRRVAAELIGGF
jgi:hypothetical protein